MIKGQRLLGFWLFAESLSDTYLAITSMDYYFGNLNPNPYYHHSAVVNMASPSSEFMLSDYLVLEDALVVDHHQESWSQSTETESSEKATSSDASHGFGDATSNTNMHMQVLLVSIFFFIFH